MTDPATAARTDLLDPAFDPVPAMTRAVTGIAALLSGAPWTVVLTTRRSVTHLWRLTNADGAELHAGIEGDHLTVGGERPPGMTLSFDALTARVRVSIRRGDAALARDLNRRLVDPYLAKLPAAVASQAREDARHAATEALRVEVERVLLPLCAPHDPPQRFHGTKISAGSAYQRGGRGVGVAATVGAIALPVPGADEYPVDVTLRVPPSKLLAVLSAVVDAVAGEGR